jgi:TPR repeat protein
VIAEIVGCAIGTPATIADEAAIAFNAEFYRAIAFGESVQGAYDKACSAIGAHNLDAVRPELETGEGVDPAQLFLVKKPTPMPRRRLAAGAALLVALLGMTQVLTGSEESPPPVVSLMTPPVEALATALELQRGRNHADAFPFLKRAAEAGNAEAMGYLGIAYLRGEGTERTPELAAYWLKKAAEKRDARGMNAYGQAYEEGFGVGQSNRWAEHWYEAAATEQNDVEAMRNLARLYRQAPGTVRHDSLALAWSLKAVDAGSVDAMVDIGLMYAEGVHGQRDPNQALGWFQRAADAGSPRAMHAIGRLNEEARNFRYAMAWYRKAADAGSAEAMNSLGVLYQNGWGVAPNRAQAARWYRRAARAGSPAAEASLAALERS